MPRLDFIWDLEDDPEGNYWHICVEGHGTTRDEVEEVLEIHYPGGATSRSSGRSLVFGWTSTSKYILISYEDISSDSPTVYPITANEAPPPAAGKRKTRKR
jgi:hypothetical protein